MRDDLTVVRTYVNETEAQAGRAHLQSLGIEALVEADNCGGMRPHMDLTLGVRLLVTHADEAAAREVLDSLAAPLVAEPWTCPACGEDSEAGFDTCWNCGRAQQ